jgi:hypothetical protein
MNLLLSKIALPLALFACGLVGGIFLQQRVISKDIEFSCPDCRCPDPVVSVQPFDVEKMKRIGSFNYSPQFSGSISVAGVDSTSLNKMINEAMDRSIKKYSERKGLFRK